MVELQQQLFKFRCDSTPSSSERKPGILPFLLLSNLHLVIAPAFLFAAWCLFLLSIFFVLEQLTMRKLFYDNKLGQNKLTSNSPSPFSFTYSCSSERPKLRIWIAQKSHTWLTHEVVLIRPRSQARLPINVPILSKLRPAAALHQGTAWLCDMRPVWCSQWGFGYQKIKWPTVTRGNQTQGNTMEVSTERCTPHRGEPKNWEIIAGKSIRPIKKFQNVLSFKFFNQMDI